MNRKIITTVLQIVIILLFISNIHAENNKWYVHADIANIRKLPDSKSSVIAKFRYNTRFKSEKLNKEWIYIETYYVNGHAIPINGWIHRSIIDSVPGEYPDSKVINLQTNNKDKIKWMERQLAYNGTCDYKELFDLYISEGDSAKAKVIRKKIEGKESTYIIANHQGRAILLGVLKPDLTYKSLCWSLDEEVEKEVKALKLSLASLYWYGTSFTGSPFAKPQIRHSREWAATDPIYWLDLGPWQKEGDDLLDWGNQYPIETDLLLSTPCTFVKTEPALEEVISSSFIDTIKKSPELYNEHYISYPNPKIELSSKERSVQIKDAKFNNINVNKIGTPLIYDFTFYNNSPVESTYDNKYMCRVFLDEKGKVLDNCFLMFEEQSVKKQWFLLNTFKEDVKISISSFSDYSGGGYMLFILKDGKLTSILAAVLASYGC